MVRSQRGSVLRRSLFQRPRSRHGSFLLMDSLHLRVQEENTTEMYSGAGSEVIPSSISSLHYPHEFGRWRSRQDSVVSPDTDHRPLLSLSLVADLEADHDGNFRFFSYDQIENAPGGSTLESAENPVDFNTNWDYTVDKFDEDEERGRLPHDSLSGYGSIESYEDRRRRRSSPESLKLSLVDDGDGATEEQFHREYPTIAKYQRFYLAEEDLVLGIAGYRNCWWKQLLFYVISIGTLGLGYLVLRWFPKWRINLLGNLLPLGRADWVVIETEFGDLSIVDITLERYGERLLSFISDNEALNRNQDEVELDDLVPKQEIDPMVPVIHFFTYRYIKFFYSPVEDIFRTNSNWYDPRWLNIKNTKDGVSQLLHDQRLQVFGENAIEIESKLVGQLLSDEVLHPFYIFQVFSIILWLADDYYYYALCIFIILAISIIQSLIETRSTIRRLQQMSRFECEVRIWRNEFWKQVESTDLVPGDVFEVDPLLQVVPCDALLVNGEVVVNESMLTGESVPVSKVQAAQETVEALPENFKTPLLSKSFLFNGTRILKSKSSNDEPVLAMCVSTGFNTTKGLLVRLMLFPKPMGFKFYEDSFKYIGFMALIAALGFTYSTYNFIKLGLPKKVMVLRALDIITIVVPPALPATLTIGTTMAVLRLKKKGIFCIAPTRVNVAGKLDVVAFDKTGTLTEDGLDVLGIHVVNNATGRKEMVFEDIYNSTQELVADIELRHNRQYATNNGMYLLAAMTTCHSLRLIDGELLGDPLDVKMFEYTGWQFNENPATGKSVVSNGTQTFTILREYEFVSSLRRMSVISSGNNTQIALVKGAPEVMVDICRPELLPVNFDELLHRYTHAGYRVIALASKKVTLVNLSRDEVEIDLTFVGFIVFENKLKPLSQPTLRKLNEAGIRTVMCTGDNVLTAILVARELSLVDSGTAVYIPSWEESPDDTYYIGWSDVDNPENRLDPVTLQPLHPVGILQVRLAITGDVFRYMLTELKSTNLTHTVLMKCDIFARMSPDEKHELVEQLQKIDYTVGFCGDGANDCGALKAADVGISLSEAEALVAAPFTSNKFEISCVLDVIREGRLSLVTSFSCFKYMSLYLAIQFITVTILYKTGTNLGDFQFLYIDLFLILPIAIFMLWSKPYHKLVTKRPTANLVSPKVLIPLICQIVILGCFQAVLWLRVQKEPWYQKPVPGADDAVKLSDNTVLFLFTNFQYILISIVLSVGPPYRQPMTKNIAYLVNLVMATLMSLSLYAVDADSNFGDLMQLTKLSSGFYWLISVSAVANLMVMLVGEQHLFLKLAKVYKHVVHRNVRQSKKLFKNLCRDEFNMVTV